MRLHGREKGRMDMAADKIRDFINGVPSGARIEDAISRTHNSLSAVITRGKAPVPEPGAEEEGEGE
jgi:hypothetical protein